MVARPRFTGDWPPIAHRRAPQPLGWLDAREDQTAPGLAGWAAAAVPLVRLPNAASWRFPDLLREVSAVAVEFDWPQPRDLRRLSDLMAWNARLPVVMFSEYHAEDLAVWAFRSGIADYVVTPLSRPELTDIVVRLAGRNTLEQTARTTPPAMRPAIPCLPPSARPVTRTGPAVIYMLRNLGSRITEREMAELCRLSVSEFSRAFHRDHHCSFRDFLLRQRVHAAASLLSTTARSVMDITYEVGFGEPSQLSRYFRRFFAVTPSEFRRRGLAEGADGLAQRPGLAENYNSTA